MGTTASPKGLKKSPLNRYVCQIRSKLHSYENGGETRVPDFIDIRRLMKAFRQFAESWHRFKVQYQYQWIRHADNSIYINLTGSESVKVAFKRFIEHESSPVYFASQAHMVESAYRANMARLYDPKLGRFGRGASR